MRVRVMVPTLAAAPHEVSESAKSERTETHQSSTSLLPVKAWQITIALSLLSIVAPQRSVSLTRLQQLSLVACSTAHRSLSLPQVLNPTDTSRRTTPLSSVYSDTTAIDWEGIKFEKRFLATAGGEPGG